MRALVALNQIELSVAGVQVRWEHGSCGGKERCPGAEMPTWRPLLFSLLHLRCPPPPQPPLPFFALRPFSLPFSVPSLSPTLSFLSNSLSFPPSGPTRGQQLTVQTQCPPSQPLPVLRLCLGVRLGEDRWGEVGTPRSGERAAERHSSPLNDLGQMECFGFREEPGPPQDL